MPARSIRVLSYNLKMLSGILGRGRRDRTRARRIMDRLLRARPAYDIICFQEVFDEDVRDDLVDRFEADGHDWNLVPKCTDNDIFQEDSGLFFASRHLFKRRGSHRFEEFENSGPITVSDYWSDKGIFGARIDLGDVMRGWTLCIFNTHMQSDPDEVGQYADVRRDQLRQIRRFLALSLNRCPHGKVSALLVGDFNIAAAGGTPRGGRNRSVVLEQEHTVMRAILGNPRDLWWHKHKRDHGFTWDGTRNTMIPTSDRDKLRLDYMCAFDKSPSETSLRERALHPMICRRIQVGKFKHQKADLSDHYAVEALLAPA